MKKKKYHPTMPKVITQKLECVVNESFLFYNFRDYSPKVCSNVYQDVERFFWKQINVPPAISYKQLQTRLARANLNPARPENYYELIESLRKLFSIVSDYLYEIEKPPYTR